MRKNERGEWVRNERERDTKGIERQREASELCIDKEKTGKQVKIDQ